MELIEKIRNENYNSKWIVDNYRNELLFVDDSFQRRYVWQEKHKIALIETILMGYAIPEIYIWNVGTDTDTGETRMSIVDGQQRIGALVSYINEEFALKKTHLSKENKEASYSGLKFSALESEDKKKIWKYAYSFRVISDEVSREDIVRLFLRLNCTDKSLNPQELRNAEFNGKFLETAIAISNEEFWAKHKIFSAGNVRRMDDVEFISSLLIFLRFGIENEITQKAINNAYDLFEKSYKEAKDDKKVILDILEKVDRIIDKDKKLLVYIRKTTHFYTIFTVIYKSLLLNQEFEEKHIERLIEFYTDYETNTDEEMIEYRKHMTDATRSKKSRMKRTEILSKRVGL